MWQFSKFFQPFSFILNANTYSVLKNIFEDLIQEMKMHKKFKILQGKTLVTTFASMGIASFTVRSTSRTSRSAIYWRWIIACSVSCLYSTSTRFTTPSVISPVTPVYINYERKLHFLFSLGLLLCLE